MKKNTIIIRSLTEPKTGYGHLFRAITLCSELEKLGYKVIHLINKNSKAIHELTTKKFSYFIIPKFSNKKAESAYISNFMRKKGIDLIIIDMREFGESLSKNLWKKFKVILIDDAWVKNVYADIIVNGTIIKNYHNYKKVNKNSQIFAGPNYWITKKEFLKFKRRVSDIKKRKKYTIVISLGGSDYDNLSSRLLKWLAVISNLQIIIILGPFFKHSSQFIKSKNITIINSPKAIWKEFIKGDLAISNAGSTLYDLSILKIPTICISVVPHQMPYANEFSSRGFSINLGYKSKLTRKKIINSVQTLLENHHKRTMMCKAANIIDGKGLFRTVNLIDRFITSSKAK